MSFSFVFPSLNRIFVLMEMALYIVLGLVCGAAVVYVMLSGKLSKVRQEIAVAQTQLASERENAEKQLASERESAARQLSQERESAEKQLRSEQEHAAERLEQMQRRHEKELKDVQAHADELRAEMVKQQEAKNRLVQEEIRNMASQMLNESKSALNKENRERLDTLLTPLKERIEAFQKTVSDNSKEGAQNKTEIKTAFEEAMKKLHDEQERTVRQMKEDQERTVRELKEQTERIGNDAASLTQALKGDSKMQGDWGEMILDKTLEDCGLIKDEQYFLQQTFRDTDGNLFRPDAVIEFPNHETAVIDSKVSLTAYQEATRAETPELRDRWLKEHVASVRAHVNELSDKNYEKLVPNCIGYVLMFIPYESGYSAAVKTDPSLLQYAYKKHIIMLSPSNLLMALQLIHTMWQNYRMNKNVEEILRQSNDLYDKFVNFAESFVKIESDIQKVQKDFDVAKRQLSEGPGNVIRRLDNMKTLGITPKKQIPEL